MLAKDLIAKLQNMIWDHRESGREEVMGELEVHIDYWEPINSYKGHYTYRGVTPFMEIHSNITGYNILQQREPTEEEKKLYGIKK